MSSSERLAAITSHIQSQSPRNMSSQRPFITCHVLDTISGKPAPGISVKLGLLSPVSQAEAQWTAKTNSDGRVTAWESPGETLNDVVAAAKKTTAAESEGQMVFKLTFDTEAYFGKGKTFWPEVELKFAAKVDEEHYHVPLLLGPWSYTTYRGS